MQLINYEYLLCYNVVLLFEISKPNNSNNSTMALTMTTKKTWAKLVIRKTPKKSGTQKNRNKNMQRQYVMDDATPGLRSILGGNVRKYANTAKCERSQDAKAFQGRVPSFGQHWQWMSVNINIHSWAQRKLSPLTIFLSINGPLLSVWFNGLND